MANVCTQRILTDDIYFWRMIVDVFNPHQKRSDDTPNGSNALKKKKRKARCCCETASRMQQMPHYY